MSGFANVTGFAPPSSIVGFMGLLQTASFRGAWLLVVDRRPVTQFPYAAPGAADHPLGICVSAWKGADRPLPTERRGSVGRAPWATGGYVYVLAGWMDATRLSRIVIAIRPAIAFA